MRKKRGSPRAKTRIGYDALYIGTDFSLICGNRSRCVYNSQWVYKMDTMTDLWTEGIKYGNGIVNCIECYGDMAKDIAYRLMSRGWNLVSRPNKECSLYVLEYKTTKSVTIRIVGDTRNGPVCVQVKR